MKKSMVYETSNGVITVKMNYMRDKDNKDTDELAFITLYGGSNKLHLNVSQILEVSEILKEIAHGNNTSKRNG